MNILNRIPGHVCSDYPGNLRLKCLDDFYHVCWNASHLDRRSGHVWSDYTRWSNDFSFVLHASDCGDIFYCLSHNADNHEHHDHYVFFSY